MHAGSKAIRKPKNQSASIFSRFYREEDRAKGLPAKALATAASEGKFEGEGWQVHKDGRRFWANVIIDPIRDTSELVR